MYTTPARTREKGRARARTEETECQRRAGRPDQRARRRIRWKEEGREGGRLSAPGRAAFGRQFRRDRARERRYPRPRPSSTELTLIPITRVTDLR